MLSTLQPMLELCEEVISLAREGDIDAARAQFDRVRMLRVAVSRAADSSQARFVAAARSQSLSLAETQEHTHTAKLLNEKLNVIQEWIAGARSGFTDRQLIASAEGIQLFLDQALPVSWDFNHDIAFVGGHEPLKTAVQLAIRGQRKVVILSSSTDALMPDQLADLDHYADDADFFIVTDPTDMTSEHFAQLTAPAPPTCSLFGFELSDWDKKRFEEIAYRYASHNIEKNSIAKHADRTVNQWLTNLPVLFAKRSITALSGCLSGLYCLVASPGPSLEDDLPTLRASADCFFIMASFRSAQPLLDQGIVPDMVIWSDPGNFSKLIPEDKRLERVPLVLCEQCHPEVMARAQEVFGEILIIPEPRLAACSVARQLHGPDEYLFSGLGVATTTVMIARFFGARSVTLLGQDLSVGKAAYATGAGESSLSEERARRLIPCKALSDGLVNTLPDYLAFIEEFRLIAEHVRKDLRLINATSSGAYLEGWEHLRLSENPAVTAQRSGIVVTEKSPWCPRAPEGRDFSELRKALGALKLQVDACGDLAEQLAQKCRLFSQSGETDVTEVETSEQRLLQMLENEAYLLKYFVVAESMRFSAAAQAAKTLSENLHLSSEYYALIQSRSRILSEKMNRAERAIIELDVGCFVCGGQRIPVFLDWAIYRGGTACATCGEGQRWLAFSRLSSMSLARKIPEPGSIPILAAEHQILALTAQSANKPDSLLALQIPLGHVEAVANHGTRLNFLARSDESLGLAVRLTQRFKAPQVENKIQDAGDSLSLTPEWQRYEVCLPMPQLPVDDAHKDFVATFAILTLILDAGPNHNARSFGMGHQSGTFEFADIQIEGMPGYLDGLFVSQKP